MDEDEEFHRQAEHLIKNSDLTPEQKDLVRQHVKEKYGRKRKHENSSEPKADSSQSNSDADHKSQHHKHSPTKPTAHATHYHNTHSKDAPNHKNSANTSHDGHKSNGNDLKTTAKHRQPRSHGKSKGKRRSRSGRSSYQRRRTRGTGAVVNFAGLYISNVS